MNYSCVMTLTDQDKSSPDFITLLHLIYSKTAQQKAQKTSSFPPVQTCPHHTESPASDPKAHKSIIPSLETPGGHCRQTEKETRFVCLRFISSECPHLPCTLAGGASAFSKEGLFLISLRSEDSWKEAEAGWLRTPSLGHYGAIQRGHSGSGATWSFFSRRVPAPPL